MTSATDNRTTELLPCPFCGSTRAPEISDVGECEECVKFDDCLYRQENHTCEGCDEWERPMFVVCNYNISGCGVSGPYRKTKAEAIAAWNTRAELGRLNATSDQESIVRSFLRKISPNRDWDYLGEHEHAIIAGLISDIAATLGSGTCENVGYPMEFECSICGCNVSGGDELGHNSSMGEFKFCPNCGKKVR